MNTSKYNMAQKMPEAPKVPGLRQEDEDMRTSWPPVNLTGLQFDTLKYFYEFIRDWGYAPTHKQAANHFGCRPQTMTYRVKKLENLGVIRRIANHYRSFRITKQGMYLLEGRRNRTGLERR